MSKNRTSDGLAILNFMAGDDPKMHELIMEESENLRIAKQIFELRTAAGLSQVQLARKTATTKSVISRLEDADYAGHSLALLQRIATVLNNRIEVHFVPLTKKKDLVGKESQSNRSLGLNNMTAISYKKDLLKQLKDPEYADMYLEQTLETGDIQALLIAVRDIVEANQEPAKAEF